MIAWERSRTASANGIIWGDAGQNKLDCSAGSEVLQIKKRNASTRFAPMTFAIPLQCKLSLTFYSKCLGSHNILDHLIRFLRWVCTSGLAADLATTDEIAKKVFEEIMTEGCKYALFVHFKLLGACLYAVNCTDACEGAQY